MEEADVAIIGGGIMGAATAFSLAKDTTLSVVLLEKGNLSGGSTRFSAAIVRHYYSTELMVRSAIESRKIFSNFASAVGEPLEFVQNSFLAIDHGGPAKTSGARVAEMRRHGLQAEQLAADQVKVKFPFVRVSEDEVAVLDKEAGFVVNPNDATEIYARRASKLGVKIYEQMPVTGVRLDSGAVRSVVTPRGEIRVGYAVNAAGPWSAGIGKMVDINIPIEAERQQLVDLKPMKPWPQNRTTVSDRRNITYLKPAKNGIAHAGGHYYGRKCDPDNFNSRGDSEFIEDITPKLLDRFPDLKGALVASSYSGLYENTPDRYPIVGESEEVKGFVVLAGWSGHGFKHGPFFGKLIAELLERGSTSVDISILKPERFRSGELVQTGYTNAGTSAPYG